MSDAFADTNVVLYLLDDGPKAATAETVLARRPLVSVQVLNETLVNLRRKAGMDWDEAATFLAAIRTLCPVVPLTAETHDLGRALAARHRLSVYDAMIAASALLAGCSTLYSEDMHPGLVIEGSLTLVNPFAADPA
ncbi:PIN domain-containing protein [Acuticoccus yangtzensis]|uniref:PIN domain-containing protein n=1 Tax=Acuticoccus yangtzensis TaxID=1443441 RepID=UPI00094967A1|nr:PIN domain-containing protein [Acuticoccus yangtzensis]